MEIRNIIKKILREGITEDKNLFGEKLKPCSTKPMTGFYRDGYCRTGDDDTGSHTVCAKVTEEFLEFTNSMGNNLDMLKPGDKWCLCAKRWEEANKEGVAPKMIKSSTNIKTLDIINGVEQELDEYARTLKNARQQGVGLRFPKSAIKANPNRFRPYSREQVDESLHKVKHFYGFLGLPNYWVDDNDKSYSEKYFNDKEYEDKIFNNFFDMDKEFGHKNSLFGTRGLEPGNPNRTSKSFDEYVERYGPMIVRILKRENIQESIKKIICQCGWSWKLEDGGNDPYTCHKCGHINSMKNIKEETNKDLSPILKNLLNKLLVKHHKDVICSVDVVHPDNRESVGIKHKNYEVILFFFGDEEEEMTYKERQKYNKLEDEAFDLVYKYTNQYADVYSKFLKSCDE